MPNFDVITIGGAVKDITFYTKQGKIIFTPRDLTAQKMLAFEYGAKIDTKEVYLSWGGGAANSAVSFSNFGLKVAALVKLGRDEASKELLNNFKKSKVDTRLVQLDGKLKTGFSVIIGIDNKEKEHVGFLYRGANNNLEIPKSYDGFISTFYFYISSLSGKNWLKNLKTIYTLAKSNNIKVAWNPGNLQLQGGKRLIGSFLKETNVLILNKDEAIELALSGIKMGRKNPSYLNKPLYLLNILHEWGPKIVIITEGVKGSWVFDGKNILRQKAMKTKVINTTGVGDAFGSSFVAGLILKNSIKKSLKMAAINSASVCSKIGAQTGLLKKNEIFKKL